MIPLSRRDCLGVLSALDSTSSVWARPERATSAPPSSAMAASTSRSFGEAFAHRARWSARGLPPDPEDAIAAAAVDAVSCIGVSVSFR